MKEYHDILSQMQPNDILFYLSVPKCKIDYIEMPSISRISKTSKGFITDNEEEPEDLDDIVYSFQADTDLVYLFHSDKDRLIKNFVNYYNHYLEQLKEEYELLIDIVPRIVHTEFVKTSIDSRPEVWV